MVLILLVYTVEIRSSYVTSICITKLHTFEVVPILYVMYPISSLIFLLIYDKWKIKGKRTVWYILAWTGFAEFFEWVCVKNHALTYTGWKLYYSIPTYPIAASMLIILFQKKTSRTFVSRLCHTRKRLTKIKNRIFVHFVQSCSEDFESATLRAAL